MTDIISAMQRNSRALYCVAELKITLLTSKSRPALSRNTTLYRWCQLGYLREFAMIPKLSLSLIV